MSSTVKKKSNERENGQAGSHTPPRKPGVRCLRPPSRAAQPLASNSTESKPPSAARTSETNQAVGRGDAVPWPAPAHARETIFVPVAEKRRKRTDKRSTVSVFVFPFFFNGNRNKSTGKGNDSGTNDGRKRTKRIGNGR
jgi:hypothetical protein